MTPYELSQVFQENNLSNNRGPSIDDGIEVSRGRTEFGCDGGGGGNPSTLRGTGAWSLRAGGAGDEGVVSHSHSGTVVGRTEFGCGGGESGISSSLQGSSPRSSRAGGAGVPDGPVQLPTPQDLGNLFHEKSGGKSRAPQISQQGKSQPQIHGTNDLGLLYQDRIRVPQPEGIPQPLPSTLPTPRTQTSNSKPASSSSTGEPKRNTKVPPTQTSEQPTDKHPREQKQKKQQVKRTATGNRKHKNNLGKKPLERGHSPWPKERRNPNLTPIQKIRPQPSHT